MSKTLDAILNAHDALWLPLAYDAGEEIDGMWYSKTHFGTPTTDKHKAWAAARELCESMDGIGFTVRRADPTAARG